MTKVVLVFPVVTRSSLSCVWIMTTDPKRPLACTWIDHAGNAPLNCEDAGAEPYRLCA